MSTLNRTKQSPLPIFVHLHKTAGTTLVRQIFPRQYGKEGTLNLHGTFELQECYRQYAALPKSRQDRIGLIAGHFPFGLHEHLNRECSYFTILRNPLNRIHSLYFFLKEMDLGKVYLENHGISYQDIEHLSIAQFVESGYFTNVDNGQVRALAGLGSRIPYGRIQKSHYERAKATINRHFDVVGITERFDESLLLLGHTYQWRSLYYVRSNTNRSKPSINHLSPEDREMISDYNVWDYKLYKYAQQRLDEQISSPEFERSIHRFQWVNRNVYAPANRLYNAAKRVKRILSLSD